MDLKWSLVVVRETRERERAKEVRRAPSSRLSSPPPSRRGSRCCNQCTHIGRAVCCSRWAKMEERSVHSSISDINSEEPTRSERECVLPCVYLSTLLLYNHPLLFFFALEFFFILFFLLARRRRDVTRTSSKREIEREKKNPPTQTRIFFAFFLHFFFFANLGYVVALSHSLSLSFFGPFFKIYYLFGVTVSRTKDLCVENSPAMQICFVCWVLTYFFFSFTPLYNIFFIIIVIINVFECWSSYTYIIIIFVFRSLR